ncbi:MAG: PqqD family peptide modification chaperone [Acidimicrobiia bacterium]|nr:PqqD family peptide modification chaperone [Acidimicrobiia bacterium]
MSPKSPGAAKDAPRRVEGLEIYDDDDGWVVYDGAHNRVHHLNASAIAVLELCDGALTVDQMAKLLGRAFGTVDPPTDDVVACIAALRAESLVV